jgi:hypothetical protein
MATPTYNKFASTAFGGGSTNDKIDSSPYGWTTIDVTGNTIIRNNLTVLGTLTYSGGAITWEDLTVPNDLTVNNNSTLNHVIVTGEITKATAPLNINVLNDDDAQVKINGGPKSELTLTDELTNNVTLGVAGGTSYLFSSVDQTVQGDTLTLVSAYGDMNISAPGNNILLNHKTKVVHDALDAFEIVKGPSPSSSGLSITNLENANTLKVKYYNDGGQEFNVVESTGTDLRMTSTNDIKIDSAADTLLEAVNIDIKPTGDLLLDSANLTIKSDNQIDIQQNTLIEGRVNDNVLTLKQTTGGNNTTMNIYDPANNLTMSYEHQPFSLLHNWNVLRSSHSLELNSAKNINIIATDSGSFDCDNMTYTVRGGNLYFDVSGASTIFKSKNKIFFESTTDKICEFGQFITSDKNLRIVHDYTNSNNTLQALSDKLTIKAGVNASFESRIDLNFTPSSTLYTTTNKTLGFTNSINAGASYSGTASDTTTPAQVGLMTIPNKGAWLIQLTAKITLNTGSDTITNRIICLSESTASNTPAAPGFIYADPIDDGAGSSGERQNINFCGVYHLVASDSKALYINAIVQTSGSRTVTVSGEYKFTRIA